MPEVLNKIILGLLGLCMANLFIYTFAPAVLATSMNIFVAVLGFSIVYVYLDEKADLKKYILWAALINVLYFASQKAGFDPIMDKAPNAGKEFMGAFAGNSARLGTYLALVLPFAPMVFIPVGMAMALITKQYVLFIPVVLMIWPRLVTRWQRLIMIGVCASAGAILGKHILYSIMVTRFDAVWKEVLIRFFDRSLIGYGLGVQIIPFLDGLFNSYLQFIVAVGILGAVWFGYVFKNIYKKISWDRESIAFMTLALSMLIEYPIETPRLWILIVGILVMFALKWTEKIKEAVA